MAKISVISGQKLVSDVPTIVGAVPFRHLHERLFTPWRDARTKVGYQRKPTQSRILKLMMEIRRARVDIPTAILLNARHDSWQAALLKSDKPDCGTFDLSAYTGELSVVDGQHRLAAFSSLIEEDDEKYGDVKIHFVMMLGADENQELEQFYIVNSTAKSVKTDLAFDLLKQRADQDGRVMTGLIESGQDWKVEAQSIAEMMAASSEIWRERIRLANEEKGITTIPSASFVNSLRKFLSYPLLKNVPLNQKFEILEAYWRGIRSAMPEPFRNVQKYTLMKGIGVWAMHEILPEIAELVRSGGDSLKEDENYSELLRPMLEQLDGENKEAELVRGPDFWLTAPKGGAAGSYSSSAGKRVLISKLRNGLPDLELE
jgi:DGQHR domain-containing protein